MLQTVFHVLHMQNLDVVKYGITFVKISIAIYNTYEVVQILGAGRKLPYSHCLSFFHPMDYNLEHYRTRT